MYRLSEDNFVSLARSIYVCRDAAERAGYNMAAWHLSMAMHEILRISKVFGPSREMIFKSRYSVMINRMEITDEIGRSMVQARICGLDFVEYLLRLAYYEAQQEDADGLPEPHGEAPDLPGIRSSH